MGQHITSFQNGVLRGKAHGETHARLPGHLYVPVMIAHEGTGREVYRKRCRRFKDHFR